MLNLKDWHIFVTALVVVVMLLFTGTFFYNKGHDDGVLYIYDDVCRGLNLKKPGDYRIVDNYMFTYGEGFKTKKNPVPQFRMNGDCKGCHGINVPRGTHKG